MGTRFTGDSKDPEVNVTTWCLLVVVILAVFARLGTKYHIFHRFTSDDVLVIFSSVCLNGLSVWMVAKKSRPFVLPRLLCCLWRSLPAMENTKRMSPTLTSNK